MSIIQNFDQGLHFLDLENEDLENEDLENEDLENEDPRKGRPRIKKMPKKLPALNVNMWPFDLHCNQIQNCHTTFVII